MQKQIARLIIVALVGHQLRNCILKNEPLLHHINADVVVAQLQHRLSLN